MTDKKKRFRSRFYREKDGLRTPKNAVLLNIAEELLIQAEEQFKIDQDFSAESVLSLSSFFGPVFIRATKLLDNGKVVLLQTKDGLRKVLKVQGSKQNDYILFYHINYCPCPAYKYQVIHAAKDLTCKHILAARIAEITNQLITEIYTPAQIAGILNSRKH